MTERQPRIPDDRGSGDTVDKMRAFVRERLQEASTALARDGTAAPALDGKLLRPLVAFASVPTHQRSDLDDRFWYGCLAVEMVHEASLLHDDILDEAPERRGRPTVATEKGVGLALVLGDHLLTSAYRAAALTREPGFIEIFIQAVERTVAGEIQQEVRQGKALSMDEYRAVVTGKSGELFRAAFSLAPCLLGTGSSLAHGRLGARLGCIYQMLDDLLDYCPSADRGKPPLQDLRQQKWTWPLSLVEIQNPTAESGRIRELILGNPYGAEVGAEESTEPAPLVKGARILQEEANALLAAMSDEGIETWEVGELLSGWMEQAKAAAEAEVALAHAEARRLRATLRERASGLASGNDRLDYFGRHAKSFRFASRLFPGDALGRVAGVYAFCRFTDDLVDEATGESPISLERTLAVWRRLAQEAYSGRHVGIPLLDGVLGDAAASGVPFHYVDELIRGVQMDVRPRRFKSVEDLRVYSYRVASVVGGWLTELFGVSQPWVLERAYALGHAMQLTNILRDVGEDARNGRVYLPQDRLKAHGIDPKDLSALAMTEGRPTLPPGYQELMEELMSVADRDYAKAFEAIPLLPVFFQGPVAVAAQVYQGIHQEIRRNEYDNLSRRARTSLLRKAGLGSLALLKLKRTRSRIEDAPRADGRLFLAEAPEEEEMVA